MSTEYRLTDEQKEQRCPDCHQPPVRVLAKLRDHANLACADEHRWWYPPLQPTVIVSRGAQPKGPRPVAPR